MQSPRIFNPDVGLVMACVHSVFGERVQESIHGDVDLSRARFLDLLGKRCDTPMPGARPIESDYLRAAIVFCAAFVFDLEARSRKAYLSARGYMRGIGVNTGSCANILRR